ncbi:MAG: hypothetical protein ACJ74U_18770 [Jatrophihabitantaceae bacterium]
MEAAAAPPADRREAALSALQAARAAGDREAMARAVLALPTGQRFGTHPGQIPALVHEAYAVATEPASRCRLAGALARAWVYGGDPSRAGIFAAEAMSLAEQLGEPEILAEALDAALLCHWGPDEFVERLGFAARLADTAAHLTAPEPRLSAHLWRLTTAWECLDMLAVQRQLRALDLLAEESGSARVAFFALSRRAMYSVEVGELEQADRFIAATTATADEAAEPDVEAVLHSLAASRARRVGDREVLAREAVAFEAFGTEQGIGSVAAEGALLWLEAGHPERAGALARRLAGGGLESTGRDVDFLLTVGSLVAVAAALGMADLAGVGAALLEPYAGRAVLNAGAVSFHGVVDDYLYRAHDALADGAATRWRHSASSCYDRIGARHWRDRLGGGAATATAGPLVVALYPAAGTGWTVGRQGATRTLPDLRGLHYLRALVRRPGQDVAALELAAEAAGHPGATIDEPAGELIDARALAAYRHRLGEIDSELAEAESWSDRGNAERLRLERSALLDEITAGTGLAGRPRRFGSSAERARTAVRKAIAAVLSRIEDHDPALGRLLRDTVRTGFTCRYEPDPARPVSWRLEPAEPGSGSGS